MMTRMMSTVFRYRRNCLLSRSSLCWFNKYVHVRVVVLQRSAYRNFQKCKFYLLNKFYLFQAFYCCQILHDFHTRCHIQGQGVGNKMYISELLTVVGYLHTDGFKNCQGMFCARCIYTCEHNISVHIICLKTLKDSCYFSNVKVNSGLHDV